MTTSVVYVFENQLFNNHEIKEYMMLKQIFLKLFSTVNHIAPIIIYLYKLFEFDQ
jgi:hypothetical protein